MLKRLTDQQILKEQQKPTLTRLIAHQITKDQHRTEATLKLRDEVLPTDSEMAISLLDQLRESFVNRSPISGRFKGVTKGEEQKQDRDTFQQMLLGYLVDAGDSRFITFSREATEALRGEMVKQPLATGGYVVFAEYKDLKVEFLLTALLSTTAQPSFDEKLNLIASVSLDLDHLRHGSRTRLAGVKKNAAGVVEFISERISEYFVNFIGCEEVVHPDAQGKMLHTALDDWAQTKNLSAEEKSELMGRAYAYWQESRSAGRLLKRSDIVHALDPAKPGLLLAHLADSKYQLAGQFSPPQPETMKRFVRFAYSGEGLKLEFDRNTWMNRIVVNQKKRTLTIIDAPQELINALSEGT